MVKYKRTSDPTLSGNYAVSLSEAKQHLRIDASDEDVFITNLIKTATNQVERITGLSLLTQTWVFTSDHFPWRRNFNVSLYRNRQTDIEIYHGPLISITSFQYYAGGVLTNLVAGTDYYLDNQDNLARVSPVNDWPTCDDRVNSVQLTYSAGYGTADLVPADLKEAMLLIIGHFHEIRQMTVLDRFTPSEIPFTAQALLESYKEFYTQEVE